MCRGFTTEFKAYQVTSEDAIRANEEVSHAILSVTRDIQIHKEH